MFYSDEALILRRGPQISAKLLQPIGILNESLCWGITVPDLRTHEQKNPHLLIAPIHPDSWPFVFRLRVSLSHGVGTLEKLCEVLSMNDVNIVVVEGGPAGHHHASLNIIGEALSVKEELLPRKKATIDPLPGGRIGLDDRFKFANLLAEHMFTFIDRLENQIIAAHQADGGQEYDAEIHREITFPEESDFRTAHDSEQIAYAGVISRRLTRDVGFLHHRIVRGWHLLYDRTCLPKSLAGIIEFNRIRAVSCRWLENLAFFSIYGSSASNPISFEYDDTSRILKVVNRRVDYEEFIEPYDPPTLAVASFDNVENYVRLGLLKRKNAKASLDRIQVKYRADFKEDNKTSKGILAAVCREIRLRDIDLFRITQTLTSLDDRGETGRILFVGKSRQDQDDADSRRTSLRRSLHELRRASYSRKTDFRVTSVEVGPYRTKHVFVSLPFDERDTRVPLEKKIMDLVSEAATIEGWIPVTARTYSDDLGPTIERKIRGCRGFMQIAYLRKGQDPQADFAYLNYEYGIAKGQEKPAIRLIDTSMMGVSYWKIKLRVDPGKDLVEFDHNSRDIVRVFRDSFKELEAKSLRISDLNYMEYN